MLIAAVTIPTGCAARPPSRPCGVLPLEASSGRTSRRRLNRGGDRRANSALYRIALSRLRWDARTRDYLARRISEGKTRRETIRCLKRYIAREIYQIITSPPEAEPSGAWHRGIRAAHEAWKASDASWAGAVLSMPLRVRSEVYRSPARRDDGPEPWQHP
jgi:hypothetical protein